MDIHGILVLKARTPCCGLKVAIDPEYGRRGLSRRLLSVAEQQARSRDLSELRLYANELMVEKHCAVLAPGLPRRWSDGPTTRFTECSCASQ
jgi:GNAT superfamily N-acetyltransferase